MRSIGIPKVLQNLTDKFAGEIDDIDRVKNYQITWGLEHVSNQKYHLFYTNSIWVDSIKFQKTELNYNKTVNRHSQLCCKCDSMENMAEDSIIRARAICI